MNCQGCGQRMQSETVVKVIRVGAFRRIRSNVHPGWHCWTCKTTENGARPGAHARTLPHHDRTASPAGRTTADRFIALFGAAAAGMACANTTDPAASFN